MSERHVVLVKPGDMLLIGNCDLPDDESRQFIGEFFYERGITVCMFSQDIDIDLLPDGDRR